jgi:hypothetical protein
LWCLRHLRRLRHLWCLRSGCRGRLFDIHGERSLSVLRCWVNRVLAKLRTTLRQHCSLLHSLTLSCRCTARLLLPFGTNELAALDTEATFSSRLAAMRTSALRCNRSLLSCNRALACQRSLSSVWRRSSQRHLSRSSCYA